MIDKICKPIELAGGVDDVVIALHFGLFISAANGANQKFSLAGVIVHKVMRQNGILLGFIIGKLCIRTGAVVNGVNGIPLLQHGIGIYVYFLTKGLAQLAGHFAGGELVNRSYFCLVISIITVEAARIAVVANSIQIVAIIHVVFAAIANYATDTRCAADRASVVAVGHSAMVFANHATDGISAASNTA